MSLTTPSVRNLAKWAGTPLASTGSGLGPLSIKGKLDVAGDKYAFENAAVSLDSIKGSGVVEIDTGRARPYIKGSLNVDTLDLNPYLSATTGTSTSSSARIPASSAASASDSPTSVQSNCSSSSRPARRTRSHTMSWLSTGSTR